MIKAVIIEDEPGARNFLESLIKEEFQDIEILGTAGSVEAGVEAVKKLRPELLFLDIRLPDGDGFEVLDQCKDQEFEVIFTTAYGEYRERAFDYFAFHYLTKPIDIDKLEEAVKTLQDRKSNSFSQDKLDLLRQLLDRKNQKLPLPTSDGFVLVNIGDIIRLEADANYTTIFMSGGKKHLITRNLKYYEDILASFSFFRIHRSHLVNTQYIQEVKQDGTLTLENGDHLIVSQRSRKAFMEYLSNLS